jgi:hypothetical protein
MDEKICDCLLCKYYLLINKFMADIEELGNINAEYFDNRITEIFNSCDDNIYIFKSTYKEHNPCVEIAALDEK